MSRRKANFTHAEFNADWHKCYRFISNRRGSRMAKGMADAGWRWAALLYDYLLYRTRPMDTLKLRLSELGLDNRTVAARAGIKHLGRDFPKAKRLLVDMGLLSITDESNHGDEWTFEFLNPSQPGLPFRDSWEIGDGISRRDDYADDWATFEN
jgi:hypothetical protein